MLLCIVQTITVTKAIYFANVCYYTVFQVTTLSSVSVTPASQVHASTTLVLQKINMYDFSVASNDTISIPIFTEIHPVVLQLNHVADRQTE
jgi:hypothetical protein